MAVFPDGKVIKFGRFGYSDYTKHKDKDRMKLYLSRHCKRENWSRSGVKTAGFWARWLLWSSPNFNMALKITKRKLGQNLKFVK